MGVVFMTIYFDGHWKFDEGVWSYIEVQSSKPLLISVECTFDVLKEKIALLFGISLTLFDLCLSYKNPFNEGLKPFDVNTKDDLDTFVHINGLTQFSWSLPLCVNKVDLHKSVGGISTEPHGQEADIADIEPDLCTTGSSVIGSESVGDANNNTLAIVPHINSYVSSGDDLQLQVGKIYHSKTEVKNALCLHSISECSQYKIVKSKMKAVTARCVDEDCKWRVRFSMLGKTTYFTTTKYVSTHTCSFHLRREANRGASYHVIADKVKTMYGNSKKLPSVHQIITVMKSLHRIDASYWKCWKAQEKVKDMIRGTSVDNYNTIPAYLFMLVEVNEGTVVDFIHDEESRFKYVFLSFGPSIRGLSVMRKVITVDGTHLSGKYGGVLLVATAQDANQQIYPVAFGIVDSENDASWNFFFKNMRRVVMDSKELVFVSDRHASIKKGIASNYQLAFHGYCIWHLKGNLRKRTRSNRILQMFIDAATSYKDKICVEILHKISEEKPKVGELLNEIGISTWARSFSPAKRYNIMTSNNAECVNALMKEGREYPVMAMLDEIRQFMTRWFAERRQKSKACVEVSTPKIEAIIQKRFDACAMYFVCVLDAEKLEFEVKMCEEHVIVCLQKKTCTCKEFDIEEIPCIHAIAAAKHVGMSPSFLVGKYYSSDSWRAGYVDIIYPLPNKSEWCIPTSIAEMKCEPPLKRKRCGRMPKARFRSTWEQSSNRKCSCCGCSGHTKRTCQNQPK